MKSLRIIIVLLFLCLCSYFVFKTEPLFYLPGKLIRRFTFYFRIKILQSLELTHDTTNSMSFKDFLTRGSNLEDPACVCCLLYLFTSINVILRSKTKQLLQINRKKHNLLNFSFLFSKNT